MVTELEEMPCRLPGNSSPLTARVLQRRPRQLRRPKPEQPWEADELRPGLRQRRKPAKRRNLGIMKSNYTTAATV